MREISFIKLRVAAAGKQRGVSYRECGAHTKRRTVGVGIWDSSECGSDIILSARMMEQLWGNSSFSRSFSILLFFLGLLYRQAVNDDSNAKSGDENVKSQLAKPREWMKEWNQLSIQNRRTNDDFLFRNLLCSVQTLSASEKLDVNFVDIHASTIKWMSLARLNLPSWILLFYFNHRESDQLNSSLIFVLRSHFTRRRSPSSDARYLIRRTYFLLCRAQRASISPSVPSYMPAAHTWKTEALCFQGIK